MKLKKKPSLLVFGLVLATCIGCGSHAKSEAESSLNMKQLSAAVLGYNDKNSKWPDKLDDAKPFIGAGGPDYATLMKNPLTGDDPGYEYVKPTGTDNSKTAMIYQLRDGKRDESLPAAFADGSVRRIGQ